MEAAGYTKPCACVCGCVFVYIYVCTHVNERVSKQMMCISHIYLCVCAYNVHMLCINMRLCMNP